MRKREPPKRPRKREAQLELERLRTPRRLSDEAAHSVSEHIKELPKIPVTVGAVPNLDESHAFADRIAIMLRVAGFEVNRMDTFVFMDVPAARGIVVHFNPRDDACKLFAATFSTAMSEAGFLVNQVEFP